MINNFYDATKENLKNIIQVSDKFLIIHAKH